MKATHRGHCQLCGSLQKLPSGVLSLHGYTVNGGYFSGVCRGAKHEPFELSKNLIDDEVLRAKHALQINAEAQHALRTVVTADTKMWVSTYVKDYYGYCRGGYMLEQVELSIELSEPDADGWVRATYHYTDYNKHDGGLYHNGFQGVAPYEMKNASAEELRRATVLKYNRQHADRVLEREAKQLRAYIKWQTERCANWSVKPLVTLDGKIADTSFKPEEVK